MRRLTLIALSACGMLMTGCAGWTPALTGAPQIEMPAEALRSCSLPRVPDGATQADLEAGYQDRGAALVACDAARRLAVPDLTTTVLTLTLTGFAADSSLAGGGNPRPGRRVIATAAMFAGAAVGALLLLRVSAGAVLALVLVLVAVVLAAAALHWRSTETWTQP